MSRQSLLSHGAVALIAAVLASTELDARLLVKRFYDGV